MGTGAAFIRPHEPAVHAHQRVLCQKGCDLREGTARERSAGFPLFSPPVPPNGLRCCWKVAERLTGRVSLNRGSWVALKGHSRVAGDLGEVHAVSIVPNSLPRPMESPIGGEAQRLVTWNPAVMVVTGLPLTYLPISKKNASAFVTGLMEKKKVM
ncbi:hypothetical protein SKAU_G00009190 [Synaphobranchus kaupii]|uniref:Uncharacterized protein n=1 Tax=Synaphobranchus kaupii TaxID=118154 RepID=A0A9Q1JB15_SYNKA|nr:hypothetical protein SKAU_G00009190 [Synaphobranchus kaupii]